MTTAKDTSKGFLQAGAMAKHIGIAKSTLAKWRKSGKINMGSYLEPVEGLFLYNVAAVEKDLIDATLTLRQSRASQSKCGCVIFANCC